MADLVQNRLARVRDGLDKDIRVAVVNHPVQLAPDHQDRRLDVGDGIAEIRLEAGIADGGKDDFVDFPVGDGLFFHYVENRPGYKRAFLQGEIQQLVEVTFLLGDQRSEEHTSELQSRPHLVCRLLLEKKKKKQSETSYVTKL